MEDQAINFSEIFQSLKKRWKLIVIITLSITLISAIANLFFIEPQYEAKTKVFIGKEEGAEQSYNQNDVLMYQKLMKTYSTTIKTRDLIKRAIKDVDTQLSVEEILSGLTVTNELDTQILEIKFKGQDPREARDVVEAVTDEFIKTSKTLVANGNVKIIETVEVPKYPVSPNKTMNIAIAFILGLALSTGIAFLLEYMDNTFKSKEQLERELGIAVIGSIPDLDEEQ